MQIKRVSSEEIKRNYTQITGREALERLLAGDEVFSGEFVESWRLVEGGVSYRDCESDNNWVSSDIELRVFLNPKDNDWYVAPPFDARKEMLARPGEWVAKYFDEDDHRSWNYIGFSSKKMHAATTNDLRIKFEEVIDKNEIDVPFGEDLDNAIPLDDADLAKLASLEKGVNANG